MRLAEIYCEPYFLFQQINVKTCFREYTVLWGVVFNIELTKK